MATAQSRWARFLYEWFKTGSLAATGLDGSAFLHLDKSQRGKAYTDIQIIFFNFLFADNIFSFNDIVADQLIAKDRGAFGFTTDICLEHPKSSGTLTLRSADPFDPPVIDPKYFTHDEDIKTMIGGIRIWEKLTQTQTFKELGVDANQLKVSFCSQHKFRSDAFWECYIRHTSTTIYHPTSTCRMGGDKDPMAVVDLELKVRGVQNLRVVDASVFPEITSGNIIAPTIMVAEKAADMIRGIDTVVRIRNKLQDDGVI